MASRYARAASWLKMLKRAMYGRAGVELLRARLTPFP
jgi:hypothetical protein